MALVVSSAISLGIHFFRSFSLFVFCPPWQRSPLPRRTNALPSGGSRLSDRAVKAAGLAFMGAKRTALTEEAGGSGAGFGREGQESERIGRSSEELESTPSNGV